MRPCQAGQLLQDGEHERVGRRRDSKTLSVLTKAKACLDKAGETPSFQIKDNTPQSFSFSLDMRFMYLSSIRLQLQTGGMCWTAIEIVTPLI